MFRQGLLFLLTFSCVLQSYASLFDSQPTTISAQTRVSYDAVTLPKNEHLGLLGTGLLIDVFPNLYSGLSIYSAVTGDRGGFFTGGFTVGSHFGLGAFGLFDAGLFAGGGGGGAAPQGGGLMLRPHLHWSLVQEKLRYSVGVSQVRFPNGQINSNQVFVGIDFPFQSVFWPGYNDNPISSSSAHLESAHETVDVLPSTFTLEAFRYYAKSGIASRSDRSVGSTFDLVGIRWRRQLFGNYSLDFSTHGAMGGSVDGYAQVFLGVAHPVSLSSAWRIWMSALAGAGGGGDVATGGGVLLRGDIGVEYRTVNNWLLGANGGYVKAVDDKFSATSVQVNVGRNYDAVNIRDVASASGISNIQWGAFSVRAVTQRYMSYFRGNGRKDISLPPEPVDLVGLKLDRVEGKWGLTGQAFGAFTGNVGGYAVGLIGISRALYRNSRLNINLEVLSGAAGGGGIAAGSGFVVQPMVNSAVSVSNAFDLTMSTGWVRAPSGDLDAWVMDVGVAYRFAMPFYARH